jgi:hypothetical protein
VRENDRLRGPLEDIQRRSPPGMAAANDDTGLFHCTEQLHAELRKAVVIVLTAAPEGVVAIVGNRYPAHAELMQLSDALQLCSEAVGALEVECDPEASSVARNFDVLGGIN